MDLLDRFNMQNFKMVVTPMNSSEKLQMKDGMGDVDPKIYKSLVGGLIYL